MIWRLVEDLDTGGDRRAGQMDDPAEADRRPGRRELDVWGQREPAVQVQVNPRPC